MTSRREARAALEPLGSLPDDALDPAEAALLLSVVDRPRVVLDPYRRHLERLAREVRDYAGDNPDLPLRHEALVQVIARRYGYGPGDGDDKDIESASLMEAIDTRRGTSPALALIYLTTARALGWDAVALDFPARVLVRLEAFGRRRIVDPYAGGMTIGPADMRALLKATSGNHAELTFSHHRPLTARGLLLRLHAKVKIRLLREERLEDALAAVEAMRLVCPEAVVLWREAGLIHARLDNVAQAVSALEEFLRRGGTETSRYSTSVLLQQLRGRLG